MFTTRRAMRHYMRDLFPPVRRFFARRAERRDEKRRLAIEEIRRRATEDKSVWRARIAPYLDVAWYAGRHDLPATEAAVFTHFREVGQARRHAPSAALAEGGGVTLSSWGVVFLNGRVEQPGRSPDGRLPLAARQLDLPVSHNPAGKTFCVVTAIAGGIDRLQHVSEALRANADFFAFVDHEVAEDTGWAVLPFDRTFDNKRRQARFVKTQMHRYFRGYDWLVWIDGNIILHDPPGKAFARDIVSGAEFLSFRHPERRSVFQEVRACIESGKDDPATMLAQFKRYADSGRFRDDMLFETNMLLMKGNSVPVARLCDLWWGELDAGSLRDQLSLPFVLQAAPDVHWAYLSEPSARNSGFFSYLDHDRNLP